MSRWQAALAYALTGEELDLPEPGAPEPKSLLVALTRAGWPVQRITDHAMSVVEAGHGWPHQVPAHLQAGCGAAQWLAALAESRRLLGLDGLLTQPPAPSRQLNPDEQRLLRDVPPHHGN